MKNDIDTYMKNHVSAAHYKNNKSTDNGSNIDLLKLDVNNYKTSSERKMNHPHKKSSVIENNCMKVISTERKHQISQDTQKDRTNSNENLPESTKKHRPLLKSIYTNWIPEIEMFQIRNNIQSHEELITEQSGTKSHETCPHAKNQFKMAQKSRSDCCTFDKTNNNNYLENKTFPCHKSSNLKINSNQFIAQYKELGTSTDNSNTAKDNIDKTKTNLTKIEDDPLENLSQREFCQKIHRPTERLINVFDCYEDQSTSDTETEMNVPNVLSPELNLEQLGCTNAEPFDWNQIGMFLKTNLYEELVRRITNFILTDCIVCIGNEEFSCHLIVLQSYSKYFENVTEKYVDLTKQSVVSPKAFSIIYEWMISFEDECYKLLTRNNCLELLDTARYLQIKELQEQCLTFINSEEVFNEETAFMLFLDAKQRGLSDVAELMIPRICNFFFTLVSSQEYLDLKPEDVCAILSSNYILINCEMEVLMSALRWLHYNWKARQKYLIDLMRCVRFGWIEPWQLIDIKRNPENPELITITKNPEVSKMIDDGLAYVIIKYWYGHSSNDFRHWLDLLGLEEPVPRNLSGVEKNYVTYRQFLEYLDTCRNDVIVANTAPHYAKTFNHFVNNDDKPKSYSVTNRTLEKKPIQETNSSNDYKKSVKNFVNQSDKTSDISNQLKQFLENICQSSSKEKLYTQSYNVYHAVTKDHIQYTTNTDNEYHCEQPTIQNEMSTNYLPIYTKNLFKEGSLFSPDRETVLIFGGIDPHAQYGIGRNTGKDVYRYVPESNVWEFVTELPEPRHHHAIAFLKGRVFLIGGADPRDDDLHEKSSVVSTVWSFDPVHRSWFSECGLNIPRKNLGLVTARQKLYAIGGQDRTGRVLSSVERYDPESGMWLEVTPLSSPRMGVATAKYKDFIWVAGGMTGSKKRPLSYDCECYDPRYDQWTQLTHLRFPRCFGRLFVMNDTLYLIGGAGRMSEKDKTTSSVEAIDVWNNKDKEWRLLTEMAIPRHGHAVAYIGTQILMIGGVTTVYMRALSNVECYCIERSTWIRGVAGLPTTLSGHGAVTLPPASLL